MFPTIDETRRLLQDLPGSYAVEVSAGLIPASRRVERSSSKRRSHCETTMVEGWLSGSTIRRCNLFIRAARRTFVLSLRKTGYRHSVSRVASEGFEIAIQYAGEWL